MKWDVCEVHESRRYAIKQPPNRCDFVMLHGNWKSDPFCVFVPMRLIPDNAWEAIARTIDAISFLEEGIEHGADIADESEAVYDAARELRGQFALDGETP